MSWLKFPMLLTEFQEKYLTEKTLGESVDLVAEDYWEIVGYPPNRTVLRKILEKYRHGNWCGPYMNVEIDYMEAVLDMCKTTRLHTVNLHILQQLHSDYKHDLKVLEKYLPIG